MSQEKTCPICSQTFQCKKNDNRHIHCSKKCNGKFYRNKIKSDPNKWKEALQYHRKWQNKKLREKLGLSLDHPPLRKGNGEGTIHSQGYKIIRD